MSANTRVTYNNKITLFFFAALRDVKRLGDQLVDPMLTCECLLFLRLRVCSNLWSLEPLHQNLYLTVKENISCLWFWNLFLGTNTCLIKGVKLNMWPELWTNAKWDETHRSRLTLIWHSFGLQPQSPLGMNRTRRRTRLSTKLNVSASFKNGGYMLRVRDVHVRVSTLVYVYLMMIVRLFNDATSYYGHTASERL